MALAELAKKGIIVHIFIHYAVESCMFIQLMILAIVLFNGFCIVAMFYKLKKQPKVFVSLADSLKLGFSGILAFISDTIGVGSFAVNVALAKLLKTFPDDKLPAVNNGAQVLPGAIESLFFMKVVEVDIVTLLTLVVGTCLGGLLGGMVMCRLNKKAIQLAMICCFTGLIILLGCEKLELIPNDGSIMALESTRLIVGFFAMFICGALTTAGIGLFVMVQCALFLLNVSPLIAFPIMTTAGALQQPLTTMVFLQQDKIPLKKTLILSVSGCIGVFLTLPLVSHLSVATLHSLLLCILFYNLFAIGRSYLSSRVRRKEANFDSLAAVD